MTDVKNYTEFYIYTIFNKINSKIYVGKTADPIARWQKHLSNAKLIYLSNIANKDLYREMFSFGKINFSFTIIQKLYTQHSCFDAEKFWISYFRSLDTNRCYNKTDGGTGSIGAKHTEDTKKRISDIKNKLSMSDANEIRHQYINTNKGIAELAKIFNISMTTISMILNNKLYKINNDTYPYKLIKLKKQSIKIENSKKVLTIKQANEIRILYATLNKTIQDLAYEFNVSSSTICNIINNKKYIDNTFDISDKIEQSKKNKIEKSLFKKKI